MLQWIRQGAGSWIIKAFLGVLIVSFAIWGIGDIFRGRTFTTAIKAGNVQVSEAELAESFQRELRRLQQALGPNITAEQARAFGLDRQVLTDTVSRVLLDARAEGLDLKVSDDTVRRAIAGIPAFQGPAGFDRIQYETVLRQNSLTEQRFVAQLKGDLTRRQLVESVLVGMPAPAALAEALFKHRNERRVAELFTVSADSIKDVPAPDAATIEAYHKENAAKFTAPEYRKLTVVEAEPGDIAKGIEVSDADLTAAYEERADEFVTNEKRDVLQLVTSDEAKAKTAQQRIAAGEDFLKVAGDVAGLKESDVALGQIDKGSLPGNLAETVFKLEANKVSEPVKSSFGYHVFLVRSVTPAVKLNLADVKDQLASQVRLARAGDRIATLSNQIQDALAGGSSLEDAAQKFGLNVRTVEAVDSRGLDPKGGQVMLPPADNLLSEAFTATTGATGDVRETSTGGLYVLRVDAVTPSALKPLDAVRDQVVAAWTADEKLRRAAERADKLAEAARTGKPMTDLAKAQGVAVSTTLPLTRDAQDADPNVAPALLAKLFSAKHGDVVTAPAPKGDGTVVARLTAIQAADPVSESVALASTRDKTSQAMGQDLLSQFQAASEAQIGVVTNDTLIKRALQGDNRG
jgi:peptidyl-prolyl cis-trans isomerase D